MTRDELFLHRVSTELRAELAQIDQIMKDYAGFTEKYERRMDAYLLRAKASFMADFYMGVENIFRTIAEELNGGAPRGDGWHKRLLTGMAVEQKGVRPTVISPALSAELAQFLGFRHVVRQAYGFQLDEQKLAALEKIFLSTWRRFAREIKSFCAFLEGRPGKRGTGGAKGRGK